MNDSLFRKAMEEVQELTKEPPGKKFCSRCRFVTGIIGTECACPDVPDSKRHPVYGNVDVYDLNREGNCLYFERKGTREGEKISWWTRFKDKMGIDW